MADELRQAIRKLAGVEDNLRWSLVCEVKSVDWDKRTCVVVHDGTNEYDQVRLRAVADEKKDGYCLKPTVGSMVVVEQVEGSEAEMYVAKYSELDEVELLIGDSKFNVVDGRFTFNDGKNGDVVILGKLNNNLDAIKQYLNTMKQAVSAGIKAVGISNAANGTTGAAAFDGAMASASLNFEDMGNDKVKH